MSLSSVPTGFFGGTLHPIPPTLELLVAADGAGELSLAGAWPSGLPSGLEIWLQYLVADASVVWGITLSNTVRGTAP
jgi:hypothetical protein